MAGQNGSRSWEELASYQSSYPLSQFECVVAVVLYTLIAVLALGGNSVVIFIILYFQRLRTPTNLLIANLAFADLLMAILCIPFSYWPILILRSWPFGYLLCKLINFAQVVAVLATSYTLVVISIDRFLAILLPLKAELRMTHFRVIVAMSFVWIVSAFLSMPELISSTLVPLSFNQTFAHVDVFDCARNWHVVQKNISLQPEHYSLTLFLIQYIVPLFVLIVTYAGIGVVIWHSRVPGGEESSVGVGTQHDRHHTVKRVRSLFKPMRTG